MSRRKDLATSRSRPPVNMFADLVTHSQNTLAGSSQASIITKHSQASMNTQSYDSWNDIQNYDDYIRESNDTLRISPDEERRIQSILELARKGKINPGNAFDVPIKVVDSQLAEDQNMRFWKFSSQLLAASMGIYDKRVEHVFQGTNRMFDSLVRFGTNSTSSTDEQPDQRSRKQRGAILRINMSQLGSTNDILSYEFASENCEQPEKINIKKIHSNQKMDPMFNKRLQAFDSDSLKSLFLNVFQTGANLQTKFFSDQENHLTFKESQALDKSFSQKNSFSLQSLTGQVDNAYQTGHMPRFVKEDIKKTNFLAQNNQTFSLLGFFLKQNNRSELVEGKISVQNFDMELAMRENQFDIRGGLLENSVQFEESHFSMPQADITQLSQLSEDAFGKGYEDQTTQYPVSQQLSRPQLFMSAPRLDSADDLTPWELQFKGMKLQRKKTTKQNKKGGKKQTRNNADEFELDFLDRQKCTRKHILRPIADSYPVHKKYSDKNILAKNIDPFLRLFAHVAPAQTHPKGHKRQSGFLGGFSDNFQTQALDIDHEIKEQQDVMDLIPLVSAGKSSQNGFSSQGQYIFSNQGTLRNIRDVKQKLCQFVYQKGHILLSQIDIGLSYASIMVVVLHLANQLKVDLEETREGDVIVKSVH